jgi:hypothetical protein
MTVREFREQLHERRLEAIRSRCKLEYPMPIAVTLCRSISATTQS